MATDWTGELTNGTEKIAYEFKGATDFACFDSVPPPTPGPTPIPFPTKGVGKMCTGLSDTCDDDAKLCCGSANNGQLVDATGKVLGKAVPSAALCNNIPGTDGKPQATDVS